jgi:hypothetical protein
MGRLGTKVCAIGAVAIAVASSWGGSGCSATKPTELVPGVITQVEVPRDLRAIRLDVLANGRTDFCQFYDVSNGTVNLPATLGVVSGSSPNTVVTVEIRGYDTPGVMGQDILNCSPSSANVGTPGSAPGGPGPRMLRRSVQSYVDGHILYLPMPLSYSCFDTDCSAMGPDSTCKGAQCVDAHVDAKTLVDFDPAFIDGTGVCFSPMACLPVGGTFSAVLVNADGCTYGFPYFPGVPPSPGLNVRVFYQDVSWTKNTTTGDFEISTTGGEAEILDLDPDEGFTIVSAVDAGSGGAGVSGLDAGPPPPTQLFRLAPGLCKLAKVAAKPPTPTSGPLRYRTISRIEVANVCAPKRQLLPICKEEVPDGASVLPGGTTTTTDGLCNVPAPLIPAPSAIYVAMDDSAVMHGAFGDKGYATAMSLSFSAPVFKRTYAAFQYLPGKPADCTSPSTMSFTSPAVDFDLADVVQPAVAMQLKGWKPSEGMGTGMCSEALDGTQTVPCSAGFVCSATPGGTGSCYDPNAASPLDLQAAMRIDTGAYAKVLAFLQGKERPAVAAAMFFVNRTPGTTNDCSPPLATLGGGSLLPPAQQAIEAQALAAYNGSPSLQTYFVVLDDDQHDTHSPAGPGGTPGGAYTFFQKVQTDVPQAVTTLDATSLDPQTVLTTFANTVTKLGTCLYELPKGLTSTAQVKFGPPGGFPAGQGDTSVPLDPGCSAATQTTANGWNVDNGRVRICGKPCDDLRALILGVTGMALKQNLSIPDVNVTATVLCGGAIGDGGGFTSTNDASGSTHPDASTGGDSGIVSSDATDDGQADAPGVADGPGLTDAPGLADTLQSGDDGGGG